MFLWQGDGRSNFISVSPTHPLLVPTATNLPPPAPESTAETESPSSLQTTAALRSRVDPFPRQAKIISHSAETRRQLSRLIQSKFCNHQTNCTTKKENWRLSSNLCNGLQRVQDVPIPQCGDEIGFGRRHRVRVEDPVAPQKSRSRVRRGVTHAELWSPSVEAGEVVGQRHRRCRAEVESAELCNERLKAEKVDGPAGSELRTRARGGEGATVSEGRTKPTLLAMSAPPPPRPAAGQKRETKALLPRRRWSS